jgi:hypothetical protein
MFWNRRKQVFQEFKTNLAFYSHAYIISYLPPSKCFGIREEVNSQGAIEAQIVLLEIVLLSSCKLYRWQRSGIVEAIERTSINQEWGGIFHQIYTDMNGEIDRELLNWRI